MRPCGLAPLRHLGFRRLAAGSLASGLGDALYAVALPWYVLAEHGGVLLLSAVLAVYGVARAASLLAGGQLSDRLGPWTAEASVEAASRSASGSSEGTIDIEPGMKIPSPIPTTSAIGISRSARAGPWRAARKKPSRATARRRSAPSIGGRSVLVTPGCGARRTPEGERGDAEGDGVDREGGGRPDERGEHGTGVARRARARRADRPAAAPGVRRELGVPDRGGVRGGGALPRGTLGAGTFLALFGACNGFANVLTLTAFQRWAPRALLGRLTSVLLLGSLGVSPISVLLGGVVVHGLGAAAFFPLAGAMVALAVAYALAQPSWRDFGAADAPREPAGVAA